MAEELSIPDILRFLGTPAPEGLGTPVSRGGLIAFLQRKRREKLLASAEERLEAARQFAQHSENKHLEQGTLELLRQRVFDEVSRNLRPEELLSFYRLAEQKEAKRREHELAKRKMEMSEQYLRIAQQRLELNAAKIALAHADEIKGLITQGEIPDGEKVQGTLARLFGEKFAKAAKGSGGLTEGNKERTKGEVPQG